MTPQRIEQIGKAAAVAMFVIMAVTFAYSMWPASWSVHLP
jgi:hypothetical protein